MVVAAGLFRVGGPFTGRERYRTNLVLESRKARGLKCPGIQDVEGVEGVRGGGRGVTHARGKQGQQGGDREKERTVFHSFHGLGGSSCDPLNGNAPLFCPPPHRTKNRKKCDETVKKRGELVKGAFFEPKKRGGIAMAPPLCCRDAQPCGGWVLRPTPARHRPRPHLTLQAFGRRTERRGLLVCRVPVVAGAAG